MRKTQRSLRRVFLLIGAATGERHDTAQACRVQRQSAARQLASRRQTAIEDDLALFREAGVGTGRQRDLLSWLAWAVRWAWPISMCAASPMRSRSRSNPQLMSIDMQEYRHDIVLLPASATLCS
jgi:hypothetical protein